jgi:tetratricopeptide (TPR) repeat protein
MVKSEPEKAVDYFKEAQLLAPDDMTIVEDLMRAQLATGQYANAEYNIRILLQNENYAKRRDLLHMQAKCLMSVDRPVEARTILVGLTTDSEGARDVEAWVDLGNACIALNDTTRLKTVSSRLMAMAPNRYEGYLMRAVLLKKEGNLAGALDAANGAVDRCKVDATALIFKGMLLQDMNRIPEARQAYSLAVAREPNRAAARELLAALEKNGSMATVETDKPTR